MERTRNVLIRKILIILKCWFAMGWWKVFLLFDDSDEAYYFLDKKLEKMEKLLNDTFKKQKT